MAHESWGYWDCIYPSLVYVSLKEFGVMGLDMYTSGIKDFHKCWSGSLANRRLCLGPASVINCTPLSALSLSEFVSREPWLQQNKEEFIGTIVTSACHTTGQQRGLQTKVSK